MESEERLETHLSLTPCLSKVAEDFVATDHLKAVVMKVLDSNQYGAVPKSSNTIALLSTIHEWITGTDGNGSTVRTILCHYSKGFDLTDHAIRIYKLGELDLPISVINWVIDFLCNRFQRVNWPRDASLSGAQLD